MANGPESSSSVVLSSENCTNMDVFKNDVVRNRGAGSDEFEDAATLYRLLDQRHSCRAFRPQPVMRDVLERIFACAQRSASWCNTQPWQIVVLSDSKIDCFRDALSNHVLSGRHESDIAFPETYEGVYRDRRRACGMQLYEAAGVALGDRAGSARQTLENFRFFGAPHVAIVTTEEGLGQYGAIDCGVYLGTFMLAAQAHGVACITQAAIASYSSFIRSHLGLPANRLVVCGVSFGYEDGTHPANGFRTPRAELSDVIDWRE